MKLIFKMDILGTDTQKENEVKVAESKRHHIPISMSQSSFCPFAALLTSSFSESLQSFQSSCLHFFLFTSFPSAFLLSLMFQNSLHCLYLYQPYTMDFTCEANQPTNWKKKKVTISHCCLLTNLPGYRSWCHSIPLSKFLQLLKSKTLYKYYSSKVSKNDKLIFEI